MGGPFSTNLRRQQSRWSSGGAGADHADSEMARHRDSAAPPRRQKCRAIFTWRGLIVALGLALAFWAALSNARAETGLASFYWHGQATASGERFNPDALTAAHRWRKFSERVRVAMFHFAYPVLSYMNAVIHGKQSYLGRRLVLIPLDSATARKARSAPL